jgi:hypothetical protein
MSSHYASPAGSLKTPPVDARYVDVLQREIPQFEDNAQKRVVKDQLARFWQYQRRHTTSGRTSDHYGAQEVEAMILREEERRQEEQ